MTEDQIHQAFIDFWADSYPAIKPGVHAINTHVAFAKQVLELAEFIKEIDYD
jgi:hypothetical protein